MASLNKVFLIGRLGNDPEAKTVGDNKLVVNFNLATSEKYKGEEQTEWHRCQAWNKTAEIIQKYVTKGSQIYIEGKIQTRSWEKDGEKKYSTEIVVWSVILLDSKKTGNEEASTPEFIKHINNAPANTPAPPDPVDDSLPF